MIRRAADVAPRLAFAWLEPYAIAFDVRAIDGALHDDGARAAPAKSASALVGKRA